MKKIYFVSAALLCLSSVANAFVDENKKPVSCTMEDVLICNDSQARPVTGAIYEFNGNNLLFEGNFQNGKLNGVVKEYYENGQLKSEGNSKNGQPDGLLKEYYENGQPQRLTTYANGEVNGLKTEYYENGKKRLEVNFKNGQPDGLEKSYYESGNIQMKGFFKDGKQHGMRAEIYILKTIIKTDNRTVLPKYIMKTDNCKWRPNLRKDNRLVCRKCMMQTGIRCRPQVFSLL
jgi:antitoxin component YwqK of YwqJK toxin-antitoxin module